ncbi:EAL domain-containing protein (plasmid) [Rhizobium oryzihabitans]|uniref:EAL domain-containing protein n=2 Tax=Rhizobium/Agrobacterium group TaxID=227290 RepID=A0A6H0ZG25_9HYPH|nr:MULTISPECIES: EAL domain-containing protein [Rhizobium/Agrobacterium group]MCW0983932.1 EAL domain-containing protein [Agrobacterium sp. BT-220-3]QCM08827.1 EAL domain-containing protein [Agrobacterium tumefaciens]MDH2092128.1 EAL domain-containing protein [Agrobacterium pusense]QIB41384.1 EAL domain-containing protein [Rhizobium oryzihabitans]QIX19798.1 EAL domain-containing protein [Agrobacterium pusense]
MYQVLNCIAFEHDPRLVILAAALCSLSSYVALSMLHRSRIVTGSAKVIWLVTGGAAGGFGIWATHFVAMLAYDPGVVVGYQTGLTLASLLVAIVSTSSACAIASYRSDKSGVAIAGILFGLGVSSMHFMGMNAIEFPGEIVWDQLLVGLAVIFAVLLGIPAFHLVLSGESRSKATLLASVVMTLAIVLMHFTAMGAITVVPDPSAADMEHTISPVVMIVTIATVAFSMLFAGLTAAIFAVRAEAAAAAGEEKFRILVQGVSDYALYMLDPDGRVSNWNTGAERAKGYKEHEIVGQHYSCFYTQEEKEAGLPDINLRTAAQTGKFEGEGWRVRKDGTHLWAHVVIDAIRSDDGRLIGYAKITRDRTEQRESDAKLRKATNDLQLALTHMANAICLFDENGRLAMYNRRLGDLIGVAASIDLTGMTLEELCLINPEGSEQRFKSYQSLLNKDGGETITELPNGKIIRATYMPTDTKAWVFTVEDITARVKSEERIAHLARHDVLTGLPNRRQFIEALDKAIREAETLTTSVAVINIDLDRFKDINDTYGHATGDEVLCILSNRMRHIQQAGELIGRFGGDEFVALKSFRDTSEVHDFISRLNSALSETISLEMTDVTPGASLGVAIYPLDAPDREKLLGNADMAMYRAKENFDETVCFYEAAMDEAERARRLLAMDIWSGMKEGQFFLNYQVQRAAGANHITGYEVLLRWNHPTRGLVPPSEFIPIAEECGAISALGEWVLEQACEDAAKWPIKEKIAVNLSPLQLTNIQLVDKVRDVLFSTGLSPDLLELEVTESAIIGDKQRALHILRQIRSMGVTIAIDDFGTGYSSLETLRSFPFDKIKLDRSFVMDLETNKQSKAFIRAILALGKSLEIPVLAEGVETEIQMATLTEEGCDQFQGYFFGRPATLHDAMAKEREEARINRSSAA